MRGALVRIVREPGLARRAGLSPSDLSANLSNGQMGLFVTCPEAGTGKPGHEAYDECPAGWSVGSSNQNRGGVQADLCVQVRISCPSGFRGRDGCEQTVTMSRPLREDPYYFDITAGDGKVTRHWFNLRK